MAHAIQKLPHPSLLILALASIGGQAFAEESPYYVGGSLGITHVSNIYRSTPGQPTNSDDVTTATLLAGLDQRIGRQRLFGDVSLRSNHYQNNTSLRNNGYGLNAGIDWQTLERLSGQLSLNANRNLAQFNPGNAPAITKKNIEQNSQARASVRYGLVSLLSLEGALTHRKLNYSASEYDPNDYQQDTISLGLTYRPSTLLTLGISGRYSDGKYPHFRLVNGAYQADNFKRRDIDLNGTWSPSAASNLTARLSYGKRDSKEGSMRDFSGGTGSLNWRWQPTAKLQINSTLMRDTGDETAFYSLGNLGGINSDYSRITNSLQVNASYEMTGKLVFDAGFSLHDRDLRNSFGSNAVDGNDKTTALSLGGRWMVTRNGLLGCQINRDKRTGQSFLSTPYTANSYGCYGQLTLR